MSTEVSSYRKAHKLRAFRGGTIRSLAANSITRILFLRGRSSLVGRGDFDSFVATSPKVEHACSSRICRHLR